MSKMLLSMFFSRILMDYCLSSRSFIHLELIFVYGVRESSSFILLHGAVQFSQHLLLKRLFFPLDVFSCLSMISCPKSRESISGFSILFHWSMCLFLCQYHALFVITALWYNLKSGIVIPPALFFLFNNFLVIRSLF